MLLQNSMDSNQKLILALFEEKKMVWTIELMDKFQDTYRYNISRLRKLGYNISAKYSPEIWHYYIYTPSVRFMEVPPIMPIGLQFVWGALLFGILVFVLFVLIYSLKNVPR